MRYRTWRIETTNFRSSIGPEVASSASSGSAVSPSAAIHSSGSVLLRGVSCEAFRATWGAIGIARNVN